MREQNSEHDQRGDDATGRAPRVLKERNPVQNGRANAQEYNE